MEGAMEIASMTAKLSVLKCWFNNKELTDCSSKFHDHITQLSQCFTINGGQVHEFAKSKETAFLIKTLHLINNFDRLRGNK